jgi:type I restriction enzyme S subunit
VSAVPTQASTVAVVPLRALIAESTNGLSKRVGQAGDAVAVLRLADIVDGAIDESAPREIRLTEQERAKYVLQRGDLLCIRVNGSKGLVGRMVPFTSDRMWAFCDHFIRLRPHPERVDYRYLAYYLNSAFVRRDLELNMVSSAGQHTVSQGTVLELGIPLPSMDRQRLIVAEIEKQFSRLDEAVVNLQRVKARLKQHKAAVLQAAVEGRLVPNETSLPQQHANNFVDGKALLRAMLSERRDRWKGRGKYVEPGAPESTVEFELAEGWAVASVQQLSWLIEYGTSAKASEDATGVPVLRMGNLFEGEISFDQLKYLPKDHNEFPRLLLAVGDVLFNRTNSPELVGKTAVFKRNSPDCSFASYLIRVRTLSGCHPEFLAAYINSVHGRRWIGSVVTQQVGQANVNGTKLQALAVPLPPLAEQHRIVAEVDRRLSIVREVEAEVEANLKRAQALRQAILATAFGAPLVSHAKPAATNKSN